METSELFRKTLKELLKEMPRGTQSRIADELGIERRYMNDFLNGRKMLSETKREQIAEKLGYSYIDFLILGREMFKEKPDKKELPIPEDNYSIILLAKSIEAFENFATKMLGENVKLKSKFKAEIILSFYDIYCEKNAYKCEPKKINMDTLVEVIEAFDDLDNKHIALFGEDDYSYKWLRQDRAFMIASCCILPESLDAVKDAIKNLDKKMPASNIIDLKRFFNEKMKQAA